MKHPACHLFILGSFLLGFAGASSSAAEPSPTPALVAGADAPAIEHEWIHLERYKPTYFLIGKPDTKVQISFKAELLKGADLYLGYTQLMLWDLFRESSPFTDVNYNPELFYRISTGPARGYIFDLGFFEHESNGQDGENSRGWNRSYIRVSKNYRYGQSTIAGWSLKFWVVTHLEATNPDLPNYRGLYEVQLILSSFLAPVLDVDDVLFRLYPGGHSRVNPFEGGQELTLRGKYSARKLLLPVAFQIFHGYAESLLHYSDEYWGVRIGLSF